MREGNEGIKTENEDGRLLVPERAVAFVLRPEGPIYDLRKILVSFLGTGLGSK